MIENDELFVFMFNFDFFFKLFLTHFQNIIFKCP